MSGQISFRCGKCEAKLKAPERKAGNSFPCPKCGAVVKVPVPSAGPPPIVSRPPELPRATGEIPVRPLTSPVLVMPSHVFDPHLQTSSPRDSTRESTEERTLATLNPSIWRTSPAGVVLWSLMVPVFGLGGIVLISWWLEAKATTLVVTTRRSTLRKGLLSKHTTEVWHRDVRNVQITQSFFQRMMNVGKIGISSAANSGVEIEIDGIADPESVRRMIDTQRV